MLCVALIKDINPSVYLDPYEYSLDPLEAIQLPSGFNITISSFGPGELGTMHPGISKRISPIICIRIIFL